MSEQTIHVLLVEDNPGDVRMVREMMREVADLEIHNVDSLATGIEQLKARVWDVVLLDLGLPDSQGLGTLRTVMGLGFLVPVVVLTGHDDDALGRAAVREGAQDYLVKGHVVGQALTRAVHYAIERKCAEQALAKSEARFRLFLERTPDGIFMFNETGRYTQVNGSACRITGFSQNEMLQMSISDLLAEESREDGLAHFRRLMETGAATSDLWHKCKDGSIRCLTLDAVKLSDTQVLGFCKDITNQKQVETREQLLRETLILLNHSELAEDAIGSILISIQKTMDFEAVGIRLREGDDCPYYATNGFSDDFLLAERYLCERDTSGKVVRDFQGNPVLECMCGNILCGRTNPALPFFTTGGSFWTNSTSRLLATTTEADRHCRTRNRCRGEGYESVALIPLKTGESIVGLLQINDHRPNRFTLDIIQFFEGLGASIGIALFRKRSIEKLKESEDRFKGLFDNAILGIFQTTPEGRVLMANSAFIRMLGFDFLEELQMKNLEGKEFHSEYPRSRFRKILEETNSCFGLETNWTRADGKDILLRESARVVRDSGGKVLYYEGYVEDVTDRKLAEEAQHASELRYHYLFEFAKEGILILDAETGMIVDVNPSLMQLFGYSLEGFQGKKVWEVGLFRDIIPNQDKFKDILAKGYVHFKDMAMKTSSGEKIDVEFVSNVYPVNDQKVIQWNIRDITESVRAREEVQALNASLERKVLERTAQIQSINQELEAFAYSISHDLKAPLRSIAGFSQALIEDYPDLLPPEGQEDLLRVKDEALRMGTLIEDLLRLSRLGKQEMSIEEVDLTSLVRSILLAFAGQEPARRAQFVLDPDLRIHGDPVLIPILFG